jgi:hypothetical protein
MGIRSIGLVLGLLIAGDPALAQNAAATAPAASAKAAKKPKVAPKPKPAAAAAPAAPAATATPAAGQAARPAEPAATPRHTGTVKRSKKAAPVNNARLAAIRETYAAMPEAERLSIQSDLTWTGDYNGTIDGDFNDRSIAAIRSFQKRIKAKETGLLDPQQRETLATTARAPQEEVGWRVSEDPVTGARLGLPAKLAPQGGTAQNGSRWSSAQGQIQIETFRLREAALAVLFEQQKRTPPHRRVGYSVLKPDFFVISGLQGLKRFYVRAQARDSEVRGVTILYDQATEGVMQPIVVAMSNSFQGFPGPNAALLPGQKRRVEYGTGIVVSASGDLLADRQVTDACQVIAVPGLGNAERVAEDKAHGLALLRVYGARNLTPARLAGEPVNGAELTLIGVADPQVQAGGRAVTRVSARLSTDGVAPVPQLGFSGAAAVDAQNRLIGMIELRTPTAAGTANPQAVLVPADAIGAFLAARNIVAAAQTGAEAAAASVVRIICVRK